MEGYRYACQKASFLPPLVHCATPAGTLAKGYLVFIYFKDTDHSDKFSKFPFHVAETATKIVVHIQSYGVHLNGVTRNF